MQIFVPQLPRAQAVRIFKRFLTFPTREIIIHARLTNQHTNQPLSKSVPIYEYSTNYPPILLRRVPPTLTIIASHYLHHTSILFQTEKCRCFLQVAGCPIEIELGSTPITALTFPKMKKLFKGCVLHLQN